VIYLIFPRSKIFSVMVQIRMHDQGPKKKAIQISHFTVSSLSKYENPYSSDLLWIQEDLKGFRYPKLSGHPGLIHRVFTRWGGASDPPYDSLNSSYTVADHPENVKANLKKIKKAIKAEQLMFMTQEHGEKIAIIRKDYFTARSTIPSADAMITNMPRIALMVKQADCQGIIIFDPEKKVIAIVHCGWRGNVRNILENVVISMTRDFGCRPSDLLAAIGPSLGPCCAEFVSHKDIFPGHFETFLARENYFDLWGISCWQLLRAGLKRENIEISGICTRCRTDLFYSYRAEGITGRFATVAMLR
jgi:YfiH family protein